MKQIIIDTYPQHGINETVKKINLQESNKYDVQHMAQELKLKRKNRYFTEDEIDFLKQNYCTMTVDEISEIIKKSKDAIIHKACKLNLKNNIYFYSDEDIKFLKDNYNKMNVQDIADKINKTYSSVLTTIVRKAHSFRCGMDSTKPFSIAI